MRGSRRIQTSGRRRYLDDVRTTHDTQTEEDNIQLRKQLALSNVSAALLAAVRLLSPVLLLHDGFGGRNRHFWCDSRVR